MSSLYGNTLLIYYDARWMLGKVLFLYITFPLMVVWIIIGLIFDLPADVAMSISGPVYVNIAIFAIAGFRPLFPVAIGMGSTRVQFLKAFYGTGLGAVIFVMLLLNICQYVLLAVCSQWFGWSNIFHPATFFRNDYQFIPYFWIDLMVGLFLFGFSFLFYCLWFRLGTARSVILLMVVLISGLFLYYGGVIGLWFAWIWALNIDAMVAFTLLGAVSLLALFCTYPLMYNAPLQPKLRTN